MTSGDEDALQAWFQTRHIQAMEKERNCYKVVRADQMHLVAEKAKLQVTAWNPDKEEKETKERALFELARLKKNQQSNSRHPVWRCQWEVLVGSVERYTRLEREHNDCPEILLISERELAAKCLAELFLTAHHTAPDENCRRDFELPRTHRLGVDGASDVRDIVDIHRVIALAASVLCGPYAENNGIDDIFMYLPAVRAFCDEHDTVWPFDQDVWEIHDYGKNFEVPECAPAIYDDEALWIPEGLTLPERFLPVEIECISPIKYVYGDTTSIGVSDQGGPLYFGLPHQLAEFSAKPMPVVPSDVANALRSFFDSCGEVSARGNAMISFVCLDEPNTVGVPWET